MNSPSKRNSPFQPTQTGGILRLRVTPKAARNAIGSVMELADGLVCLKLSVTTVPEAGKANKAVIALLSKTLSLPKAAFTVKSGATDRNKLIEITGDAEEISTRLEKVLAP